jgi:hypothetical protein
MSGDLGARGGVADKSADDAYAVYRTLIEALVLGECIATVVIRQQTVMHGNLDFALENAGDRLPGLSKSVQQGLRDACDQVLRDRFGLPVGVVLLSDEGGGTFLSVGAAGKRSMSSFPTRRA